uniref:DC1 domain-containing protein n=1 Tax=Arundo donax TaxID=35708 RepID=A0A0A8ZZ23_ARUDO
MPVYCNICTNEIEGMHYQCTPCGVFLHPVCVQLQVTVSSTAHPQHDLTLVCTFPTMCGACHTPSIWAYRCFRCLVFSGFHSNCLPESHHLLGDPYTTQGSNGAPDRRRQFGRILPPTPPPPPRMIVDHGAPFAGVNPLGIMDPFNMPRRGPSTTPSLDPDPCGGAFPYSGEYGRSTFGQGQ